MSKKSLKYMTSIFLLLVVLGVSGPLLMNLKRAGLESANLTTLYLAQLGIYVFVGIILGFCDFINKMENRGSWRADVGKIIIWGIPMGLVACSYLIYYTNIPGINIISTYIVNMECGQVAVTQVILGYVLITSFYKKTTE
ncbi:MAG: hypothetical protein ABFD18_15345 [Syntrophomonas sp.]